MKTINLRIAELRKRKNITQQELADIMGLSFQTISKWENSNGMPDISLLPMLADYFQVSVDQLLGLRPLNDEIYISKGANTSDYWNDKLEYLIKCRKNYWNQDYLEFLVQKVWKITKPVDVLDCACGFGFMGLMLMPLLPEGSTYTGIDFSENLLVQGRKFFEIQNIKGRLICQDVYTYEPKEKFDIVLEQNALRHLNSPEVFLKKMLSFGKDNALIISMCVNREFECDGLYVEGMDYAWLCEHEALKTDWKTEKEMQGRDHAIAMKTAPIMAKLGLREVDVRMNDCVEFVSPHLPDYEERKKNFLSYNGWDKEVGDEELESVISQFTSHKVCRKDAEDYCKRNQSITEFFRNNPQASYTYTKGQMITYGRKKAGS